MYTVDQRVFVKHPKKSWTPGKVTALKEPSGSAGFTYTVMDDGKDELQKVREADLTLCRDDLLNEGVDPVVHDLLFLTILHDATLLRCLHARYMKDIVYTNIGAIVVALNPFNYNIPWYKDAEMDKYLEEGNTVQKNLPHSWAVAHNTYFEMLSDRQAQTILVSGESGAGKTEACKMVMKYLGRIAMRSATEEEKQSAEAVRLKINQCSPILESFGNAKTVRNNNSSRFGKFVKTKFTNEGLIAGAHTTNYLLEKSRIITAAQNERVYHSFYQLLRGKQQELGLDGAKQYKSTASGQCTEIEGVDDGKDFEEVCQAFNDVGIPENEQQAVWTVVAGCLLLQNIEFEAKDADSTTIAPATTKFLEKVAAVWKVPVADLERELLTTTSTVRGETFVMKHKLPQAIDARDSLCKHMYDRLFALLVQRINDTTDAIGEYQNWIGVLDIFGFEDFTVNSFEQVCINLANETLQNHYNTFIFRRDLEECRAEGINMDDVACPDNSACLRLISDSNGVMSLLDDECRLGKGNDAGFLEKVTDSCKGNPFFEKKPTSQDTFIVKHYAGDVTYTVTGFVEKNRDTLKDDLKRVMRLSQCPVTASLLPAPTTDRVGRAPTVGGFFKQQVAELMYVINSTNPHWIRCIKPHPAKKPLMFDGLAVTNQLESSGVLGTVKVRKAGYPVRIKYLNFLERYKILVGTFPRDGGVDVLKPIATKATRAAHLALGSEVQMGTTRVFLKGDAYFVLEKVREEASIKFREMLQTAGRCITAQIERRKKIWLENVRVIQDEFRQYLGRSVTVRMERRKARAERIAKHRAQRVAFEEDFATSAAYIADEEQAAFREIALHRRAFEQWMDDKRQLDAEAQKGFMQAETLARQGILSEVKAFYAAQRQTKNELHVSLTPEVEDFKRLRISVEEQKVFNFIQQLFDESGAGLFRAEMERAERRFRRILHRIEDLQFLEMQIRMQMLPQFVFSLHRVTHPFGPTMAKIKAYSDLMAARRTKRERVKHTNSDIQYFTERNPSDKSRLAVELAARQLGTHTSAEKSYLRQGDKAMPTTSFAANVAWQGISGVPDLDQMLLGVRRPKKTRTAPKPPPGIEAANAKPAKVEIKTAGVFESFSDYSDEMQFLRVRHILAKDFRELANADRYSGRFAHETEIKDRRTLRIAQDELQTISIEFAAALVAELRKLNTFCTTRQIPEQNHITGEWVPFKPVPKAMLATYPHCTDWKALSAERARLTYATSNYKRELLHILNECAQRGARIHVDPEESPSVEEVHVQYLQLRGHFKACSRCLSPMASKATLVQLRILWPKVQCSRYPDRCRSCNASPFTQHQHQPQAAAYGHLHHGTGSSAALNATHGGGAAATPMMERRRSCVAGAYAQRKQDDYEE